MRVYLPATSAMLRRLLETGAVGPVPLTAFAVTADVREWYLDDDIDELEYAALRAAARASLRLIDADPGAVRRRVVVALDAPDATVSMRDDIERGVVHLTEPTPLAMVACVHADDADAEPAVAAAANAVLEADLGEATAQDVVDDADGFELSWYASQEIAVLLESM